MNLNHKASRVLILGPSGSGKTTLAVKILRAWRARFFFFFDPELEWSRALGFSASSTVEEMALAMRSGVVAFDPGRMFAGDFRAGFDFFCRWSYAQACAFQRAKVFVCDEVQNWTDTGRGGIPASFSTVLEMGRRQELDWLLVCHAPNLVNDRIRNQLSNGGRICAFRFNDPLQVDWLARIGFTASEVETLPDHAFLSLDCRTGQVRRGGAGK